VSFNASIEALNGCMEDHGWHSENQLGLLRASPARTRARTPASPASPTARRVLVPRAARAFPRRSARRTAINARAAMRGPRATRASNTKCSTEAPRSAAIGPSAPRAVSRIATTGSGAPGCPFASSALAPPSSRRPRATARLRATRSSRAIAASSGPPAARSPTSAAGVW
jgi:hypothetical protein